MKIRNRFTDKVIFEDDAETTRETVVNAVESEANLSGAYLRRANLRRANLSGANLHRANLREADLRGANLDIPFTPDPDLIQKVAVAALQDANGKTPHLKMDVWHTCETVHCIAGWIVTIHPEGKMLERFTSTYLAARLLGGETAAKHFFDSDKDAKAWLSGFLPDTSAASERTS